MLEEVLVLHFYPLYDFRLRFMSALFALLGWRMSITGPSSFSTRSAFDCRGIAFSFLAKWGLGMYVSHMLVLYTFH